MKHSCGPTLSSAPANTFFCIVLAQISSTKDWNEIKTKIMRLKCWLWAFIWGFKQADQMKSAGTGSPVIVLLHRPETGGHLYKNQSHSDYSLQMWTPSEPSDSQQFNFKSKEFKALKKNKTGNVSLTKNLRTALLISLKFLPDIFIVFANF